MVLPALSKPATEGTAHGRRAQPRRQQPAPPLHAAMACDTAFRIVAGHYLRDLTAHHQATCEGDVDAVHQMRLALTRLRTAIAFFLPMVGGPQQARLGEELKWLNTHLGAVRDLDVAIERLKEIYKRRPRAEYRSWSRERAESQRRLTRALRSARYRRLNNSIADWIEKGSWATKRGRQAATSRACPVTEYSARKLMRWREKLIKKSRKLEAIGPRKRHQLRLMNKRFSYAIEAVTGLVSAGDSSRLRTTLKVLRRAQRSLGQLNDDARCRSLATTLGQSSDELSQIFLGARREKRLMRTAAAAYEKLAELKPLRIQIIKA
jgi:CHAD domain-containing protein